MACLLSYVQFINATYNNPQSICKATSVRGGYVWDDSVTRLELPPQTQILTQYNLTTQLKNVYQVFLSHEGLPAEILYSK